MSHITEITELVFNDVEALKQAVKKLQSQGIACSLVPNAVPRAYYNGQLPQADHVLKLDKAAYDVGFYYDKAKKGLIAKTDFFMCSVQSVLGAAVKKGESVAQWHMGKLYHAYAVAAATRQAVRQGYQVRTVQKEDGTTQLVMTGMKN